MASTNPDDLVDIYRKAYKKYGNSPQEKAQQILGDLKDFTYQTLESSGIDTDVVDKYIEMEATLNKFEDSVLGKTLSRDNITEEQVFKSLRAYHTNKRTAPDYDNLIKVMKQFPVRKDGEYIDTVEAFENGLLQFALEDNMIRKGSWQSYFTYCD